MMSTSVLVAACGVVASLLFFRLPFYNDWLYVQGSTGWTCVTQNDWIWMAISSFLLLLAFMPRRKEAPLEFLCTSRQAFFFFLGLNVLWFILSIIPRWPKENTQTTQNTRMLNMLGGTAAWPAMFNLAMVLFPVQRMLPLLEQGFGLAVRNQALPWHKWCGHALLLWLALHTILLSIDYALRSRSVHDWLTVMVP